MTTPITTTTQLEALPPGSIVLVTGIAWQRDSDPEDNWWTNTHGRGTTTAGMIFDGPAIVLHVPGQAPTVKPGRDELARTIDPRPWSERHMPFRDFAEARTTAELIERDRESVRRITDDVLAILPGKTTAQVRAEALRDAAAAIVKGRAEDYYQPSVWLYARADEEAGK